MQSRTLGNSKLPVSEMGLGCWQLGPDWGKDLNEDAAFAILQEAVNQGITFFDTADVYGNGKSESLIGAFLKATKAQVTVATKYGRMAGIYPDNYTKDSLRSCVEASLNRLQTDSLDVLQLHCIPTEVIQQGAIFDWLRDLQSEGLIKHFGASIETIDEGLLCLKQEGLASLQVIFNVFRQRVATDLLPAAQKAAVGIIARVPLASGLLTGKFTKDTTFVASDHRHYNKDGEAFSVGETFAGLPFEAGIEAVDYIEQNILPKGMSMLQLALRWILDHEAVSTVIPGASSPKQVVSNAEVSQLEPLSPAVHEALQSFYVSSIDSQIRGNY